MIKTLLDGRHFRNASLSGSIPDWNFESLTHVDLAFNHLTGTVPQFSDVINGMAYLYVPTSKKSILKYLTVERKGTNCAGPCHLTLLDMQSL